MTDDTQVNHRHNQGAAPADTRVAVWPTLRYRDAIAALDFLVDAFGFERAAVLVSDDGAEVLHAELRWPLGGGVMVGSDRDTPGWPQRAGHAATYVVTDEPDVLFARARRAGAQVLRDLRDESYGSRGFVVRDPEGNLWSFGTYAGEQPAG